MRARSSGSSPSGTGSAVAMLQRGSRARLRPCSAIVDTTSTGSPASVAPKVTIDAHGVPSSDSDASEPELAAAMSVRASSPGVRRRGGSTSCVGSAIAGPSPGPPWFSLDSVVAFGAVSLMVRTVPRPLGSGHGHGGRPRRRDRPAIALLRMFSPLRLRWFPEPGGQRVGEAGVGSVTDPGDVPVGPDQHGRRSGDRRRGPAAPTAPS